MIATTIRSTVPHVTNAQINHCHPIWNCQTGSWFYHVESESDPTKDYAVHYYPETDTYTCTCPCGLSGFASCKMHQYCKHVYWCCAHYQRYINPGHVHNQPLHADVDVAAHEDSWLNDVPRSDVMSERHPAVFVPPTWIN